MSRLPDLPDWMPVNKVRIAVVISALICWIWISPYSWFWWIIWTVIIAIPALGLILGIQNWENNVGSTKNIATKGPIGVLAFLVIVFILNAYNNYSSQKDLERLLNDFNQTLAGQIGEQCRKNCDETYGFQFTKPNTWHLLENTPWKDCHHRCYEEARWFIHRK